MTMPFINEVIWPTANSIQNRSFICGFCNIQVASVTGWSALDSVNHYPRGSIYICPNCQGIAFFTGDQSQYPSAAFGNPVQHVPDELNALYEEARRCTSQSCYTAAVLLCRKMLMNIAVEQSAKEGLHFIEYVNFLADKGYVPPNGKHWVDHIRKKGNEATHEIALMNERDARELLIFLEMLLHFIYEFPKLIPAQP